MTIHVTIKKLEKVFETTLCANSELERELAKLSRNQQKIYELLIAIIKIMALNTGDDEFPAALHIDGKGE